MFFPAAAVRRVGGFGPGQEVGGKDQVMDGDAVVIHQDALDIVRAAGGGTVEHVGDVGGDGGEVVEILEAPDLLNFIGEHPVEEQVAALEAHGADGDDGAALLEVFVGDEVLRNLGNGGDHQVRAADDLLIGVAQDEMHVRVLTEQVHDAVFVAVAADHLHHGQVAPLIDAGHDVVIVAVLLGDVDFGGQGVAGLFPQGLVHSADELAVRSLGCNGPDGFKIKYFRVFSLHFHLSSLI